MIVISCKRGIVGMVEDDGKDLNSIFFTDTLVGI